jgi:hypothetical protein
MPPVLPVDFIGNESILKKIFSLNAFIYKTNRQTIKKLKLDNLIIITAYNPMYGLSMINQLNEYLNITTVMTVWIQHKSRIYNIEKQFCKK